MAQNNKFNSTFIGAIAFCTAVLICAVIIVKALPSDNEKSAALPKENVALDAMDAEDAGVDFSYSKLTTSNYDVERTQVSDVPLLCYRDKRTKGAVEYFYEHVVGNKEVTHAILAEADANSIPLSLAFALAHTESNYNPNAKNVNTNKSIDRGLFQLNNRSFPQIKERDFFNPQVSAKYGMQHLRYCLNIAKKMANKSELENLTVALAYYNTGSNKAYDNRTPHRTLAYMGRILAYQKKLDRMFDKDIKQYLDTNQDLSGIKIAYMDDMND